MATTNNAISFGAGLSCTALSSPAIGTSSQSARFAYTDGDPAGDNYVNVTSTDAASTTALHTSLGGNGFVEVTNPGPADVNLFVGASTTSPQAMGPLPAPAVGSNEVSSILLPVKTGVIYSATITTGTQVNGATFSGSNQVVGVTYLKISANAA